MAVISFFGNLLLFLIPAAALGRKLWRLSNASRDEWRLLAWVPIVPLAAWGVFIAWGVTRDPTSHNLWPFELVFWALVSGALLGLFLIGRGIATRADARNDLRRGRRPDDRT